MAKKKKDERNMYSKAAIEIIDRVTDEIKKEEDEDGLYKIKGKNKNKKRKVIKKICPHWRRTGSGDVDLAIETLPNRTDMVRCRICGRVFPGAMLAVDPATPKVSPYTAAVQPVRDAIETVLFYTVRYGGDEEDIKRIIRLRADLKDFLKQSLDVSKCYVKMKAAEDPNIQATSDYNNYGYGGLQWGV